MARHRLRWLTGVALVGACACLIFGCSDDALTVPSQDEPASVYGDVDVLSALVAANDDIAQVAADALGDFDAGIAIDPGAIDLANQHLAQSGAALTRLYGTASINPAKGAPVKPGGLCASLHIALVANGLTDALNAQATQDAAELAGSQSPDLAYAQIALSEDDALLDLISQALDSGDDGVQVSEAALKMELQTEQASVGADLTAAQIELLAFPAPTDGGPTTP